MPSLEIRKVELTVFIAKAKRLCQSADINLWSPFESNMRPDDSLVRLSITEICYDVDRHGAEDEVKVHRLLVLSELRNLAQHMLNLILNDMLEVVHGPLAE